MMLHLSFVALSLLQFSWIITPVTVKFDRTHHRRRQIRRYNRYVNPYRLLHYTAHRRPRDFPNFDPWSDAHLSNRHAWQSEAPSHSRVYDILKQTDSDRLAAVTMDKVKDNEYGIHSIPGLSEEYPPLEEGFGQLPTSDNMPGNRVWNEEGQFWGYNRSAETGPSHQQIGRGKDDGTCIPPFCIPVQCPDLAIDDSKSTCDCSGPPNCSLRCQNGGICKNNSCCCKRGYTGPRCEVLKPDMCRTYFRLTCSLGCTREDMGSQCVCNPYRRGEQPCRKVELDILQCPEACNGRGTCDKATRECKCSPGFAGPTCSMRDFCAELKDQKPCQHKCVNHADGHQCICPTGYQLAADGTSCEARPKRCPTGLRGADCTEDVDECQEGEHRCEQLCRNTNGGYQCDCHPGWTKDTRDPYKCLKMATKVDCRPRCVHGECHDGQCKCKAGFTGEDCSEDVDECHRGWHNCEQVCRNTPGGFECSCRAGFEPHPADATRCQAVEPACHQNCVYGRCTQDGRCQCKPGFEGADCSRDINECSAYPNVCEHDCINTIGSYECQCRPGFLLNPNDRKSCQRVGCPVPCLNGQCNLATQRCECLPGFEGPLCEHDVDECGLGLHRCQQICVNLLGSYRCDCYRGFRVSSYDPHVCEPVVDPCAKCQHDCVPALNGNRMCKCFNGYLPLIPGDESVCVEACKPAVNCLKGRCSENGRSCVCNPGWQGAKCDQDIDECLDGSHRCEHECRNSEGGYSCACHEGTMLGPDGRSCVQLSRTRECAGGCLNGGRCIDGICQCLQGYRGPRCEERIDFCQELRPCQQKCYNNADPTQGGGYRCSCELGMELASDGKSCEPAKRCATECHNNGRCYQGKCLCAAGYHGASCELDIDECSLPASVHKCLDRCVNTDGDYECICPAGHYRLADRKTCVRKIPDYTCQPSCKHGGVCGPGNKCNCPKGLEGVDCTIDIDECAQNKPCAPEVSRCVNLFRGFECRCNEGYVLMRDRINCMTEAEARSQPDMVHHGIVRKGISTGSTHLIVNSSDAGHFIVTRPIDRRLRWRRSDSFRRP